MLSRAVLPATSGGASSFASRVLEGFRGNLGTGHGKTQILDLGPPRQSTLDYFLGSASVMHVGDLPSILHTLRIRPGSRGQQTVSEEEFARLLRLPVAQPLDAILGWDYFDYLAGDTLAGLMTCLARRSDVGTQVYFLTSTVAEIPYSPGRFAFGAEDLLVEDLAPRPTVAGPAYAPRDLEMLMPSFPIERLALLGNGYREHLHAFDEFRLPHPPAAVD